MRARLSLVNEGVGNFFSVLLFAFARHDFVGVIDRQHSEHSRCIRCQLIIVCVVIVCSVILYRRCLGYLYEVKSARSVEFGIRSHKECHLCDNISVRALWGFIHPYGRRCKSAIYSVGECQIRLDLAKHIRHFHIPQEIEGSDVCVCHSPTPVVGSYGGQQILVGYISRFCIEHAHRHILEAVLGSIAQIDLDGLCGHHVRQSICKRRD